MMLAVEVSEFEFTLARFRRERAAKLAGVEAKLAPGQTLSGQATFAATTHADREPERLELFRALERQLESLRALIPQVANPVQTSKAASPTSNPTATSKKSAATLDTNQEPSPKSNRKIQLTMMHLLEDWKRKQTRHRTVNAVTAVVSDFRDLHGPMPVHDITRQHARDYRDQLIERRLSRGTIENRLGFLSTLVRHGMVEIVEDLPSNPFEKIDLTGANGARPAKNRRAYSIKELNLLFASALYTKGHRPQGQAAEAAYWIPLLGPFVGARLEELCQLRIEDVQRINGTWCLRICDLDESQQLKNDGSFRRVPLHETVIKTGFLVYAAETANAGHLRLFPSLRNKNANRTYSNALGKWYGRYLETIGLDDPRLDYHSHRYNFRQQCSLCDIDAESRDALTGHWLSANDAGRTYLKTENNQYSFPKLVNAIALLRYEELHISHLFVDDPMAGVNEALLR